MTSVANIRWGKYKNWEGPYFGGSKKYILPVSPTPGQRAFDVITRTEGGAPDAINMYDRCVLSIGYIQWCEASYFSSSNLLGKIAEKNLSLLTPLKPALDASNVDFVDVGSGKWRLRVRGTNNIVDSLPEQHQTYFLNSNGSLGSWDGVSKSHAKLWAACISDVLLHPEAESVQVDMTIARLRGFATPEAQAILWGRDASFPDEGWVGAMRTAYLSFASNLPAAASKSLLVASSSSTALKWSKDWCITMLRELTFGPKISIYPDRYNKIRPYLEKNYGIDLPDFFQDLQNWHLDLNSICDAGNAPTFTSTKDIQELLIDLGYDVGPAGADDVMGKLTQKAIGEFQQDNQISIDSRGSVGLNTRTELIGAWKAHHQC
jgi:hypothetical protein